MVMIIATIDRRKARVNGVRECERERERRVEETRE
jgi:hypothetical protein